MRPVLLTLALSCFLAGILGSSQARAFAGAHDDFGVFCVRGRLALEQRRIEELKSLVGHDVCRLDQEQSEAAARAKVLRLGGIGAPCSCD